MPSSNCGNIKIIKQGSTGPSRQKPGDLFTDPSRRDPWADRPDERRPPPFDDPYYRYHYLAKMSQFKQCLSQSSKCLGDATLNNILCKIFHWCCCREFGRYPPPPPHDPFFDPYRRGYDYYERYPYPPRDPFPRGKRLPRLFQIIEKNEFPPL